MTMEEINAERVTIEEELQLARAALNTAAKHHNKVKTRERRLDKKELELLRR